MNSSLDKHLDLVDELRREVPSLRVSSIPLFFFFFKHKSKKTYHSRALYWKHQTNTCDYFGSLLRNIYLNGGHFEIEKSDINFHYSDLLRPGYECNIYWGFEEQKYGNMGDSFKRVVYGLSCVPKSGHIKQLRESFMLLQKPQLCSREWFQLLLERYMDANKWNTIFVGSNPNLLGSVGNSIKEKEYFEIRACLHTAASRCNIVISYQM